MGLTGDIEEFIKSLFDEDDKKAVEIGRNNLAQKFNCAPSQINYVLTTRFSPYRGYSVESRRGGSGYIRIVKLSYSKNDLIKNMLDYIGDSITLDGANLIISSLEDDELISPREAKFMAYSIDNQALENIKPSDRNKNRASILKNVLLVLLI